MEIEINEKTIETAFVNLKVGDCFMLPNSSGYIFLRIEQYTKDFNESINAISLNDFDCRSFPLSQKVVRVEAKLTIYR